jgi:hypothetical protein
LTTSQQCQRLAAPICNTKAPQARAKVVNRNGTPPPGRLEAVDVSVFRLEVVHKDVWLEFASGHRLEELAGHARIQSQPGAEGLCMRAESERDSGINMSSSALFRCRGMHQNEAEECRQEKCGLGSSTCAAASPVHSSHPPSPSHSSSPPFLPLSHPESPHQQTDALSRSREC